MAMDDLKERLREQASQLAARIQESSAWNQLVEKYQDLSPNAQKAVLAITSFVIVLILLLIPYTFFSSSQDEMATFEGKKTTIRKLYRVSRAASSLPPVPFPVSASELRSAVQGVLSTEKPSLLPEQTVSMLDMAAQAAVGAPKGVTAVGLAVTLSRLNLDQIVKLGTRLQTLRPTTKLTGLKIQATPADTHYYDVTYKIVAYNLPTTVEAPKPSIKGGKPGKPAKEQ